MYNARASDVSRIYTVSVSFSEEEFSKLKLIRADFGESSLAATIRRLVESYKPKTKTLEVNV